MNLIDETNGRIYGDWKKETYNLDKARTRTSFIGYKSVGNYFESLIPIINMNGLDKLISSPRVNYKSIQIDFLGFNKLEYYAKHDNIEK